MALSNHRPKGRVRGRPSSTGDVRTGKGLRERCSNSKFKNRFRDEELVHPVVIVHSTPSSSRVLIRSARSGSTVRPKPRDPLPRRFNPRLGPPIHLPMPRGRRDIPLPELVVHKAMPISPFVRRQRRPGSTSSSPANSPLTPPLPSGSTTSNAPGPWEPLRR